MQNTEDHTLDHFHFSVTFDIETSHLICTAD